MAVFAYSLHADTEARRKARYYYSAAIQEQALGNDAQAYEYFKKSYNSDTTYAEGAMAYGNRRLYIPTDTMQSDEQLDRSLNLMRPFVDLYPDDIYESINYGFIAGQLERTDEAVRVLERAYSLHPETSNILLELSDVHARAYDLPNAIETIDRYERQEGMNAQISTRKISYLLADNDTVGALAEATKLIDSDPSDVSYRIIKGNVFDILSMPDSAYVYFKQAEDFDPESGAAKLALAGYYLNVGDSVQYDNKMYEVLLTEDLGLDQKAELVAQYLEHQLRSNNDPARGDYLFSVLMNQYPHEPRVLDLAARYSAAKGDFPHAVEQITYAIDLDPTNATYWGQLMAYQTSNETPEDALVSYENAKKHIVPDNQLKFYYASIAQLAKEYDKAIAMYREMIDEIEPGLATDRLLSLSDVNPNITMANLDMLSRIFAAMGDVYNLKGSYEDSWLAYDNSIVLDSSNAMAKNNYAYFLCINGGDLEKAYSLSSEAIQGEGKNNPTYLDTYSWILYLRGEIDAAEENQLRAVELSEQEGYRSSELYSHLGDILAAKGEIEKALENWRKAVKIQEEMKETDEPSYSETLKKIAINTTGNE